jgi:hypothetical protein
VRKIDLKKKYHNLYSPSARKVQIVKIPKLQFAMLDGKIERTQEPATSPGFHEAMMALYGMAYTLKFTFKMRPRSPVDYPVMALEGLWWVDNGVFDISRKDNWHYTLMMLLPEIITRDAFDAALAQIRRKGRDNPSLRKVRLEHYEEGLCMQVMHVGPYATEPDTIERMTAFAHENGYVDLVGSGGKHHEVYMGDPRRADPAKLKTILRHPLGESR